MTAEQIEIRKVYQMASLISQIVKALQKKDLVAIEQLKKHLPWKEEIDWIVSCVEDEPHRIYFYGQMCVSHLRAVVFCVDFFLCLVDVKLKENSFALADDYMIKKMTEILESEV